MAFKVRAFLGMSPSIHRFTVALETPNLLANSVVVSSSHSGIEANVISAFLSSALCLAVRERAGDAFTLRLSRLELRYRPPESHPAASRREVADQVGQL